MEIKSVAHSEKSSISDLSVIIPTSTLGNCPICHERKNELGVLGGRRGCRHQVCRRCIIQWMRTENSCPICRTIFNKVVFPVSPNLRIYENKHQPVSEGYEEMLHQLEDERDLEADQKEKEELQYDIAQCMFCREDTSDTLLMCDNHHCFKAAHMRCLDPPLSRVPRGEWICPDCEGSVTFTLNIPELDSEYKTDSASDADLSDDTS